MDAMKNAADFDDEEIIDLTDIIEKGAAPAPKGGDLLDDQLSDLTSASNDDGQPSIDLDMDADIDALLAQMGGDPTASTPENALSGMGQESHAEEVNPDETLDMPGMAEVDSLLQELDMPPQPNSTQASGSTDGAFDEPLTAPASAVDLDALLDGMLDGNTHATGTTAGSDFGAALDAASTAPDDSLDMKNLGAPSSPNMLDDLDDLLGSDTPTPAAAPAPAAASTGMLDDLDALFGADAAAPAPAPAASADMLDDLDDLLGSDTPTPAAAPAPAAASTGMLDDLDALFGADAAAPAPAPAASADMLDDLDALLGSDTPTAQASPQVAPIRPDEPLNVTDLDDLLGQTQIPVTSSPDYVPDVGDLVNLDALLGAASPPAREPSPDTLDMLKNFDDTPSMAHTANTSVPTLAEDLMALDVMLGTEGPEDAVAETAPDTTDVTTRELMDSAPAATADEGLLADLDALLGGATLNGPDMADIPDTANTQDMPQASNVPDALEDLLGGAMFAAPEATDMPDMEALQDPSALSAEDSDTWRAPLPGFDAAEIQPDASSADMSLEDIDPQELNRAAQELLDEKVMLEATTGDVDTSAWLSSLDEALDEEQAKDDMLLNLDDTGQSGAIMDEGALLAGMDASPDSGVLLPENIVPPLHGEDYAAGQPLPEGIVPPMPLAAAAALGATAMAMASGSSPVEGASAHSTASAAAVALSEEDRARISELEERLMALEDQWQTREASHRQLLDHMGTQDLHHSERLSALEARLASVQSEAHAETSARLTQLEFRLDDVLNQPTPPSTASLSAEDEELRAARLDLMDGRIMVLEDAEEQRCAREKAAEEHATSMAEDSAAEGLPQDMLSAPLAEQDADASADALTLGQLEERLAALENQTVQGQVELEERLTSLEGQFRQLQSTMEERLNALQGQFKHLESAMEERLEQKAAAAAAKIIREEIAALLTEESK